jgi:hypothetical protein
MAERRISVLERVVRKLMVRLVRSSFVFLLIFGGIMTYYSISSQEKAQYRNLDILGSEAAKLLAMLSRIPLEFEDTKELSTHISTLSDVYHDFYYAAIIDDMGKIVVAQPSSYIPAEEVKIPPKNTPILNLEISGNQIRHFTHPISLSFDDSRSLSEITSRTLDSDKTDEKAVSIDEFDTRPGQPEKTIAEDEIKTMLDSTKPRRSGFYIYMGFNTSRIESNLTDIRNNNIFITLALTVVIIFAIGWMAYNITKRAQETGDQMEETNLVISQVVQDIRASASQILAIAQQTQTQSADEAAAVDETRRTMEALVESSNKISEGSQSVLSIAEQSAKASATVATRISKLNEQAHRITTISETIRGIADKSDILALNASLEGTKAGEVGRGFTLLGVEMRRLAETVMGAVREIKQLADEIQSLSQSAVLATEEGQKLSQHTTETSRKITLITGQQRTGTQQVMTSMNEIQLYTQVAIKGAEESVSTANNLIRTADELSSKLSSLSEFNQTREKLHEPS